MSDFYLVWPSTPESEGNHLENVIKRKKESNIFVKLQQLNSFIRKKNTVIL